MKIAILALRRDNSLNLVDICDDHDLEIAINTLYQTQSDLITLHKSEYPNNELPDALQYTLVSSPITVHQPPEQAEPHEPEPKADKQTKFQPTLDTAEENLADNQL